MMFLTGALSVFIYVSVIEPYSFYFSGLTLIAFVVSFYGFKQPAIFNEKFRAYSFNESLQESQAGPYSRSSLSKKDMEVISKKLIETFRVKKPYINSDLTLQDVATMINVPRHHLTQVLNTRLRKNFYLFVNEFRVEEVKKRMKDKKYQHYSILAIAFDSGFSSKSAFNHIFKNTTGMTPSDYLASTSS